MIDPNYFLPFQHFIPLIIIHSLLPFQYKSTDDPTKISVRNFERIGAPDGKASAINGYAFVPDASEPGQLSLRLDGVPYGGTYWVLALGPVVNGFYEWSIVSDKSSHLLFVLARNVDKFEEKYDKFVLNKLSELGFTFLDRPIEVYQGKDCKYESST